MSAGHVIVGNSLSITVTLNDNVDVFIDASVAVYVTVVVPIGKKEPIVFEAVNITPGQLSEAVGSNHGTFAPHIPSVLLTVIFENVNGVIVGF
jgi:hypothetical protein